MTHATRGARPLRFGSAFLIAVSVATLTSAVSATAEAAPAQWGPCPAIHGASADTVCTVVKVPRDYARPTAGTIAVTVSKLPAREPSRRRGVLVGNPGGPGEDGISMFTRLATPAALRDEFDLVAVQPRGLLDATPVDCAPPPPTSPATYLLGGAEQRTRCEKGTPGYTRTITTENTARDIESVRRQLGLGTTIDLFGVSYGTTLMSTYATLFPQHTGKLVLDSAVDPRVVWNALLSAQVEPYRARVNALFAWIAEHDNTYHLGATPLAVYRKWSAKVTEEAGVPPSLAPPPARVGDTPAGFGSLRAYVDNLVASATTGRSQATSGLLGLTRGVAASRSGWPLVAQRMLAGVAPPEPAPSAEETAILTNLIDVDSLLFCNENAVAARPELAPASLLDTFVVHDVFTGMAYNFRSGLSCSGAPPVARPVSIRNRGLAVAPLQIQSLGDPQTPYLGGLVARNRMGAHLITVGGGDHGQFGTGNPVVDAAVVDYLRTGRSTVTSAPQAPIATPLL